MGNGLALAGPEPDLELWMFERMRSRSTARAGLLAGLLLLTMTAVTGCRMLAPSSGGNTQVTIKAQDTMRFDPTSTTVPVGQAIQFTLVNDGSLNHDFVLTDGVAEPVKVEAAGKASASGSFTIVRPGTYTYVCAQPGHEAAGMKGTIVAR
jgi:plastocyanin